MTFDPAATPAEGDWEMLVAPEAGKALERSKLEATDGQPSLSPLQLGEQVGAMLLRGGCLQAIVGRRGGHVPIPVPVPLSELPAELRPASGR
jgi:hypothetical protein